MAANRSENSINRKEMRTRFILTISGGFVIGALLMLGYNLYTNSKADVNQFIRDSKAQERFRKFGGPEAKPTSQSFTTLFSAYLNLKDPIDFSKRYVAGAYYTMTELENYFAVIKGDHPDLNPNNIRVYLCPEVYSPNTTNPINGKRVDDKLSNCLVFMKDPYDFLKGGKINIDGNPNCLGSYNWGDLEP